MIAISLATYHEWKQQVEELEWLWRQCDIKQPNEWYQFKYQGVVNHYLSREPALFSRVSPTVFHRKVKMPKEVYDELKELASISRHLTLLLAHPPYGGVTVPPYLKEGTLHEGRKD